MMNEFVKWFLSYFAAAIILAIALFGIGVVIVFETVSTLAAWGGIFILATIIATIFRFTACKNIEVKRFLWMKGKE